MSEHLVLGSAGGYRLEPVKVNRVTFTNDGAAVQGVIFSSGRLASTEPVFTLKGSIGITSQFDLGGFAFPDGFTVTPTSTDVNNIIIEYEDA